MTQQEPLTVGPFLRHVREVGGFGSAEQVERNTEYAIRAHTIRNIEDGKNRPTPDSLEVLAKHYKLDFGELLLRAYAPDALKHGPEAFAALSPDVRQLVNLYLDTAPSKRRRLLRLLEQAVGLGKPEEEPQTEP